MNNQSETEKTDTLSEKPEEMDLNNIEAVLRRCGITLRDNEGNYRSLADVLGDISAKWENYGTAKRLIIADTFTGTENVERFHAAVNALAERWCGVSNAFSVEQTTEILTQQTARGENTDIVIARMCALAYGTKNITVADAALIADDELRRGVRAGTAKLIADALDFLVRHWRNLNDSEKRIVVDVVVGELKNDTGTAA